MVKISDTLRREIRASPMTQREICKRLVCSEVHLSNFMHGNNGLSLKRIEKLCQILNIELEVQEDES